MKPGARNGKLPEHPEALMFNGPRPRLEELFRVIRIASEFIRGFRKLHFVGPCVTVFGSARFREDNPWYMMAQSVGRELGERGFTVMTGGGPEHSTTTLEYLIYNHLYSWHNVGYAAGIAWFVFIVVFIITLLNWRFGGKLVQYSHY